MVSLEAQATGLNVIQSDSLPKDTHLTECVVSMSLNSSPIEWAEKALAMPQRDRKVMNKEICDTKYNLKHTVKLITKLYEEMAEKD